MLKRQSQLLALLLGLCVSAVSQETRGSLSGFVSDSSGAVVPGATMQLTNIETGVVLTATSNEAGLYRFLFLNPGQYKLVATANGFKTFERDRIQLNVSEAGTVPVVLEVGAQNERITVVRGSAFDRRGEGRPRHIDIPTGQAQSKSTPVGTRDAVAAALRAGADGVLLSRKYSEMKLANLRGAGEAIKAAGLG